jgi:hypothetical protein
VAAANSPVSQFVMAFMTSRSPAWVLFALLLSACAGTPTQVTSVARTDLGCDQVQVAEIAKNRYAASGCGKGGVYAQLCGGGEGCSWVRLRGAEQPQQQSSGGQVATGAPPREIIQAPPPAPREIIQAPPPAQREIIQAPPPAGQASAPLDLAPNAPPVAPAYEDSSTQPVPTAPAQQSTQPLSPYAPQPTPLSQGQLSDPYQAEVPLTPVAQRVEYPPPAPLLEQRPLPPAPSYTWIGGYWSWGMSSWLWAPGYWCAPRYGYNYIPGSWYWANNYWYYGPGGWARPGSTYIAYGLGPRPYRHYNTRSFTPRVAQQGGRIGVTGYGSQVGNTSAPLRMGSAPARMGGNNNGYARAPAASGFTPQGSPMYRYPSSVAPSARPTRMAPMQQGPASFGGNSNHSGYSRSVQPSSAPQRFGSPSSSGFRPAPMHMGGGSNFGGGGGPSRAPMMRGGPAGGGGHSGPASIGGHSGGHSGGGGRHR